MPSLANGDRTDVISPIRSPWEPGLFCPDGADVFVGGKSSEGLESSDEVIGVDEVGEVLTEALDGSFF